MPPRRQQLRWQSSTQKIRNRAGQLTAEDAQQHLNQLQIKWNLYLTLQLEAIRLMGLQLAAELHGFALFETAAPSLIASVLPNQAAQWTQRMQALSQQQVELMIQKEELRIWLSSHLPGHDYGQDIQDVLNARNAAAIAQGEWQRP